jgi:DNA-binding response OmpR family regulator
MGTAAIDLDQLVIKLNVFQLVPEDVLRRLRVLPLLDQNGQLSVAVADAGNASAIDEVAFRSGRKVIPFVALDERIESIIEECLVARRRGDYQWRGSRAPRGEGAATLEAAAVPPDDDDIPLTIVPGTEPPRGAPPPSGNATPATPLMRGPTPPTVPEPFEGESSFAKGRVVSDVTRRARSRVLVVDDEPVIRQILKQGLTQRGMEVLEAGTGMDALRLIKDREPDAIVLDAMLPDVHGFDICKRLRESRRYHHVPVVMVTAVYKGWRMAADMKETYGVHAYIEKPFDLRDVVRAVDDALAGKVFTARPPNEEFSADAKRLYADASEAYRKGDLDVAISGMASAVALDPLSASLRHQLGLLYAQRGHDFAAMQELEMAVDLDPARFQSLRNLAILFQRRGLRRKACEMWERALSNAPDDATRQEIRDILLQLF